LKKRFIKADQLWEALYKTESARNWSDREKAIGMILKDMGYLSVSQISEILQTLEYEAGSEETYH